METERITIRLPTAMVSKMDSLTGLGQYATRTEVVRTALRMFFEQQGARAKELIEAEEGMGELQQLAAKKEALRNELRSMLDQI